MTTAKKCENCYDIDREKLQQYIYAAENSIANYNKSYIQKTQWGYGSNCITEDEYRKLHIYRGILQRYDKALRLEYKPTVCESDIQTILEKTYQLVNLSDITKTNVQIDSTNFDLWVVNNPYCVAYEDWEKSLYEICPQIGITVTNITQTCNFVLDISSNKIEDNCKFLYTLSIATVARQQSCFDINVKNLGTCKINYETIVKKYDCDLDFNTYVSLLNCNLSHKVVTNLLDCGVTFKVDSVNLCPIIKTKDSEYKIADINVNILSDGVDSCTLKSVFNVSKSDIDPEDLEILIGSYNNLDI